MRTRRARPLLGTLVDIRVDHSGVDGVDEARALAAIDAAFAEIADVHRLMSFHEATSDVARINREASRDAGRRRSAHARSASRSRSRSRANQTGDSIRRSRRSSSRGTCCRVRAMRRHRPSTPTGATSSSAKTAASARPSRLWIDLGGIAKGYAVDRAIDRLRAFGIDDACVNAGGDLRRIGRGTEPIHIRMPRHRIALCARCCSAKAASRAVEAISKARRRVGRYDTYADARTLPYRSSPTAASSPTRSPRSS